MAYAIIRTGGKQFRAEAGQVLHVPSINKRVGEGVNFDVLVASGDDGIKVGSPLVEGAQVAATILGHDRGEKIIVFKKKRRKQYKRKQGHRQNFTKVKIDSIG